MLLILMESPVESERLLLSYLNKESSYFNTSFSREVIVDSTIRAAFDDLYLYQRFTLELATKFFLLAYYLGLEDSTEDCGSVAAASLALYDAVDTSEKLTASNKRAIHDMLHAAMTEYMTYKKTLTSPSICEELVNTNMPLLGYIVQLTFAPTFLLGICSYSGIEDYMKYKNPPLLRKNANVRQVLDTTYAHLISSLTKILARAI